MNKFVKHLVRWVAMKAYLVIPGIYLLIALFVNIWSDVGFNVMGLLFSILLGALCYYAAKSWYNHEYDDDEIDFVKDDEEEEDSEVSIKQLWNDMPWWERLHWIPILGFLGLTWWAMVKGLGLLFVGGLTPFVYIFSTIVTLTLLWLIMMISRKKNILGFVIFYIVFDAMSAFSFNFVEFYDNVSGTQHMDRDMKDCRRLSDIEGEYIAQVGARIDSLCSKYGSDVSNTQASIKAEEGKAQEASKKADANRQNQEWLSARTNRNTAKSHSDRALALSKQLEDQQARKLQAESLKASMHSLKRDKGMLDSLAVLYRNDKQHFTSKDWQTSKDLAQRMGMSLDVISHNALLGQPRTQNDAEVKIVLNHLKSNDQDRFASLNKLFKALASLFIKEVELPASPVPPMSAQNLSVDSASMAIGQVPPPPTTMRITTEERQFENRLLYLSVMLSILIDLLPLALGVFVAYSRRHRSRQR